MQRGVGANAWSVRRRSCARRSPTWARDDARVDSPLVAHELNQPLGAMLRNAEAAELFLQIDQPDLDELRTIVADIRKDDERAAM